MPARPMNRLSGNRRRSHLCQGSAAMKTARTPLFALLIAVSFVFALGPNVHAQQPDHARRVIIFVWDGLRMDDLTPEITPNYFALARSGVVFTDHHAVYPTFTMMNSASIATGTYPGVHGFYGNVVYAPRARGKNAKGVEIDFSAPAFIEDFGVVEAVRESYQGKLTLVTTMLQAAKAKGLATASIGKFVDAFRMNDEILGRIVDKLRELGWERSTDIIITQDHGHSSVSGDLENFPLRGIADGSVGPIDPQGYSVSGFVRTAELLSQDGLKAYDGASCRDVPTLSGIVSKATQLDPSRSDPHGPPS